MRQSMVEEILNSPDTTWMRIGVITDIVSRSVLRKEDDTYVPIGLYNRGRGIFQKPVCFGKELGDSIFYWVKEGDLVLSGQFAWEGAVAIAKKDDENCIASHRYTILRGKQKYISNSSLLAIFKTQFGDMLLNICSRGAAGRNRPLNEKALLKEKIPVPKENAQKKIEELIRIEAKLIEATEKIVKSIEEYKANIAEDVVLGKLDVREFADSLSR
jgi:type I restriction enzyme, S subunit